MAHVGSEAIRMQNCRVEIGDICGMSFKLWALVMGMDLAEATRRTAIRLKDALSVPVVDRDDQWGQDDSGRRRADPAVQCVAAQGWRAANPLARVPGVVERVLRDAL